MLRIPCPWCGVRDHTEFTYLGDATVKRPDPESGSDAEWMEYVYLRDNPRGDHREFWHHVNGCRRWLIVNRNTVTHEIASAEAPHREEVGKP
jgi:heterotetrameric sarcosine oxidase delta subunit